MSSPLRYNVDASQTTLQVEAGGAFSLDGGVVLIESEQVHFETCSDLELQGCIRGFNGTTAAVHANGKAVVQQYADLPVLPPTKGVLTFKNVKADIGSVGAATASSTICTPTVTGLHLLSFYGIATSAPTGGDAAPNLYLAWTDEVGVQKYFYFAGNLDPVYSNGANQVTIPIYATAGQPIWMATSAGVYGTLRFSFYFGVQQI